MVNVPLYFQKSLISGRRPSRTMSETTIVPCASHWVDQYSASPSENQSGGTR